MKIAVYAIAKNEEQFVARWAESCKEADYRFILDTGSTDKTVELARTAGVEVAVASVIPWRFDTARNISLGLLPADIDLCIALDLDEVLTEGWRSELEKTPLLGGNLAFIGRPTLTWNFTKDGEPGLQYGADRVHSRHGIMWRHPAHELVGTYGDYTAVRSALTFGIDHHADPTKSRGQYLSLLKMSVNEQPDNDRCAFYYARELFYYGKRAEAATEFKRYLGLPSAVWAPERAAAMRYLAKCIPDLAYDYLSQAVKEAPGRREALVELAQFHYSKEDWRMCKAAALQALDIEEKPLDYFCEEFAWGGLPYDLAAISAYNLGDKKTAYRYGGIALGFDPENDRLAGNMEFYKP